MLRIENDWIVPVNKVTSKINKFSVGRNICDYLILHYTASTTAKSAHNTFLDPTTKVSWHLTVDVDGTISQLYDFRKITWHAGLSKWGNIDGMNKVSIGIEIVNPGVLVATQGVYKTWTGQTIAKENIFIDNNKIAWAKFPQVQIDAVRALCKVIVPQYKIKEILGHNEISPGRKSDPGSAFVEHMKIIRQENNLLSQ